MILIAANNSGIAQLRYQKREKAVSYISINIFSNVSEGVGRGGGYREKRKIDVSCGKNQYVRFPL